MASDVRITTTVARVLRIFLDDLDEPRYGFELMKLARVPSGTLYPILARLESAGWIEGHREPVDPSAEGRPARRFYVFTPQGAISARQELAELSARITPGPVTRRFPRPESGRA
ncbi:helix-turn-helix transcriptional regulator [Nonomuraea sp. NPDC048916]|uniref:PadR family transcriptional regulator n=1 Tax=Nonomuraea sp. NPDC048916 TaxID=3154232 RepID=UPI0033DC7EBC